MNLENAISLLRRLVEESSKEAQIDELPQDMTHWRERIDELDRLLVFLLNERSKSANEIGKIKEQGQQPIYVPEREKEVLNNVLDANSGPLDHAAVRRIFERIIDETRSLERRKYQKLQK